MATCGPPGYQPIMLVQCPLAHDPQAYYNPQAEPFLAWEIKEGCRRQTSKPKSTDGLRERKPNYRETDMTLEEIEDWLKEHIELRRNVITTRTEYRWKDDCMPPDRPWENFDDIVFNDVWRLLQKIKPTNERHLRNTVESGFVANFNPFRAYLDSLPPWDGDEYIRVLASSVTVAGGFEKLGFEEVIVDGTPGYIAVVRTDDEMKARASMMAMQAKGGKT